MKTRREKCNKELLLHSLSLSTDNYLEFYQSQWQLGNSANLLYVVYRLVLALLFSVTLVIAIIDLDNIYKSAMLRAKWMIYLTNWHFSVATLQAVISAYMVTSMYLHVRKRGESSQLSGVNQTLCNVYWPLYTIAVNGSLFVSIVYWTMVYDEKVDPLSVVNIFTHAVNAVLLLIDCFIAAHSIRFLHFYLPLFFNLIYVFFSLVYYHLGGTSKHDEPYIYSILNWQKPLNAVRNICFVCICAMVLHVLVCFYIQLRKHVAKLLSSHDNSHMTFPMSQLMEPLKEDCLSVDRGSRNDV